MAAKSRQTASRCRFTVDHFRERLTPLKIVTSNATTDGTRDGTVCSSWDLREKQQAEKCQKIQNWMEVKEQKAIRQLKQPSP